MPAARAAVAAPENAEWLRYQEHLVCRCKRPAQRCIRPRRGGCKHSPVWPRGLLATRSGCAKLPSTGPRSRCAIPATRSRCPPRATRSHRFRRDRDAAHLDGLLPVGPLRRRHLREHHGFLLGIPMVEASADASPFVIWEGSHEVVRAALCAPCSTACPPMPGVRSTSPMTYHAARRTIFDTCKRVVIAARPGEAYLVHRLAVHGMAPWGARSNGGAGWPDDRIFQT